MELTCFERSGFIAEFSCWNGGGDEGGYGQYFYQVSGDRTLTDEDQPILGFSYNAVYDDEGIYTGTGVTENSKAGPVWKILTVKRKWRSCWQNDHDVYSRVWEAKIPVSQNSRVYQIHKEALRI